MQSKTLLTIATFILTLHASAQVGERRSDFALGAGAGWTLNQVSFNPTIKQTYKTGPTIGFSARYICEKYFTAICGVQMEVNYTQAGWKEVIEDGSLNEYQCNLNYIQVPLLMQMGWGREKRGAKFIFEAGPQLGYCLSSSEKRGGSGAWDTSSRPGGVTHQYENDIDNKFDYGITAGLGMEISTGIGHFLLQGRYYFGLADFYDNSKKGYFSRSANSSIVIKLNYLFDIK